MVKDISYFQIGTKYKNRYFFHIQGIIIKTDISFWLLVAKIHEN